MIDNLIVLVYLLLVLGIGVYYRSHSGSFKSFANVKDSARKNKLLLIATIFASSVGGGTTFGIAEKAFSGDISYTYGLLFTIPIDLLIAIYVVPRIAEHYGAESVGDIMVKYYGLTGRIISGIASITISIGFLAAQISVSGRIFEYILQVDYLKSVILSYIIVIIYTTIGGLRSVMFTNLLQFFAMIVAIPIITIIGLNIIGLESFINNIPNEKVSLTDDNLIANTIAATLGFATMNLYPNFIQRALINNDFRATTTAIYIKTAIYSVYLICVTLNGLIAFNLYPEQPSNLALPYLIDQIIPIGLLGFVVVGLLAAVMSTADSDLNVSSVTLVKDIFDPILNIKNQHKLLLLARIINVIIGSFAIIFALKFNNVVDLIVYMAGFWGPLVVVPLIFALFNVIIPKKAMVFSSISGCVAFLLWEEIGMNYFNLKAVFVGTVVSLIFFIGGLLLKNKTI